MKLNTARDALRIEFYPRLGRNLGVFNEQTVGLKLSAQVQVRLIRPWKLAEEAAVVVCRAAWRQGSRSGERVTESISKLNKTNHISA